MLLLIGRIDRRATRSALKTAASVHFAGVVLGLAAIGTGLRDAQRSGLALVGGIVLDVGFGLMLALCAMSLRRVNRLSAPAAR